MATNGRSVTFSQMERNQVFVDDEPVHALVDKVAEHSPHAVAVTYGDESITYEELVARADRLARALHGAGVGLESVVAVCLPRGVDLVIAQFAVLKAGGAFLPLDPADPPDRLGSMAAAAGARIVVSTTALAGYWAGDNGLTVIDPGEEGAEQPLAVPRPDNTAYLIYTSGSTGIPKAVMIHHRGLTNLLAWHRDAYELKPDDRCPLLSRVAFDASCWEIWATLVAGATLVVPPSHVTSTDPDALFDWIADDHITIAFLPPQLTERLYRHPRHNRGGEEGRTSRLRVLLTGADRLTEYPSAGFVPRVANHYGATETTILATAGTISPRPDSDTTPPDVGSPITNSGVHVLDDAYEPVPAGTDGDIHITGIGLAHGYLNQAAATARAFVPDPHGTVPGSRMYKTGDVGRLRPDGRIEYVGRTDRQVKIRGHRIECGEVEAWLRTHPAVSAAAVTAGEDAQGGMRLIAYFVPHGERPAEADIRDHLAAVLPDYMLPATYRALDAIPMSANGKVDYQALPATETDRPDLDVPYVAPRDATEQTIARIWSELLSITTIGVYDNFFDLGGYSLLATEVVQRVRAELGTGDLDVRIVFDYPTIAELRASLT